MLSLALLSLAELITSLLFLIYGAIPTHTSICATSH
jgi:hypothetical protein